VTPPVLDEPEPGVLRVALQGGFPKDCTQRPSLQLIDRAALAERQLRWLWEGLADSGGAGPRAAAALIAPVDPGQAAPTPLPALPAPRAGAGLAWGGDPAATPSGVRVLARHIARPWGEVLRHLNKQSDNALTRLLYLQLGLAGMAADPARPPQRWPPAMCSAGSSSTTSPAPDW